MTKKHEGLVEEIRDQLHRLGDVEFDYIRHLELPVQEMDVIVDIIALALSAVRDGRLDEELGVVGRENVKTIVDAWLDEMILIGATDFIAFRKEGK